VSDTWNALSPDEQHWVNPFDFKEAFASVLRQGGFDAVIGNPPYVLMQSLEKPEIFQFFAGTYQAAKYKIDTNHIFIERATALCKNLGRIGYIVPNTFLRNRHAIELRRVILDRTMIERIRLFDYNVFNASVDTAILIARASKARTESDSIVVERSAALTNTTDLGQFRQSDWAAHPKLEFQVGRSAAVSSILAKCDSAGFRLGEIATAYFGIQTFDRSEFVSPRRVSSDSKPVIDGDNISRYGLAASREYVTFRPEAIKSGGKQAVYVQERICVRQIGEVPIATLVPAGIYSLNTIYNIFFVRSTPLSLRFVLGVINSRLTGCAWRAKFFDQKQTFPKIKKPDLLDISIPRLDLEARRGRTAHSKMISLVSSLLTLNASKLDRKTPDEMERLRRQIEATNRQVDQLVYELYDLTDEEIRVVESSTPPVLTPGQ
jgi:hypothetical protein